MSWGVYFAGYNRAKARYQRRSAAQKLPPHMHLLAAGEAGALVPPASPGMQQYIHV